MLLLSGGSAALASFWVYDLLVMSFCYEFHQVQFLLVICSDYQFLLFH